MNIGDTVTFHLILAHKCGAKNHCECSYSDGEKGPRGFPGAMVTRAAKVTHVFEPDDGAQALALEVAFTHEDLLLGYATTQSHSREATTDPPESGTWTASGAARPRPKAKE